MQSDKILHISVMPQEVIEFMNISNVGKYLDATFGHGGHSKLLLEAGVTDLYALDRDENAIELYSHGFSELLKIFHNSFLEVSELFKDTRFKGILMDLGVSTLQLLEGERGFSFSNAGPLDMRMDPSKGLPLSAMLEEVTDKELALILKKTVDLSNANFVASLVKRKFEEGLLQTTEDLANLFPKRAQDKTHPATQLFLGLRMWVNEELRQIEEGIPKMMDLLAPGGRLVVITFHSTEDRLVKNLFRHYAGVCICENDPCYCNPIEKVKLITRKAIKPTEEEIQANPRSRSALLRCVEKRS